MSASRRIDVAPADLLPPEPSRASRMPARPVRMTEVLDAHFEVISGARATARPVFNDNRRSGTKPAGRQGRTSLFGRVKDRLRTLSRPVFAVLTALMCGTAFLVSGGALTPHSHAAETLGIDAVTTQLSDLNGMRVVGVYGTVVNETAMARRIPPIHVTISVPGGPMMAEGDVAGPRLIAPGERRAFSVRMPHAGGNLPEVTVSLAAADASPR